MPLIEWTPDLTVGIDKIDDQHKRLFQAADDLGEAMWAGKGVAEINRTVAFLLEYTQFHFGDEEELMIRKSYPGLHAQQEAHKKFTHDIKQFERRLSEGQASSQEAIEVLNTVCDWLRNHIRVMDKALGDFLKETV